MLLKGESGGSQRFWKNLYGLAIVALPLGMATALAVLFALRWT